MKWFIGIEEYGFEGMVFFVEKCLVIFENIVLFIDYGLNIDKECSF